jgi:hypothetical protein
LELVQIKPSISKLVVFVAALGLYALSAGVTLQRGSLAPHYVHLAYSLLRGHVDLVALPPTMYDLLAYQGRWFVAGSPLPAILLMPFVALWGLGVSDIPFGVIIGALNVALVYDLLGVAQVSESARRWLTALFAAGTVHWYAATLGSYWFNAHVVAVLFVTLYARETLGHGRGWLAGLWLALAGLARPTALFAAPFFIAWLWMQQRKQPSLQSSPAGAGEGARRSFLKAMIGFGITCALGLGAHLAYNAARFGSPLDFGYAYVQGAENITSAYARYGGFNLRFVPFNLYVSLLRPPDVLSQFPFLRPSPWGMSILLTTPAFLYIFRAFRREPIIMASWVGLLGVMIPLWMYHNTGSLQFGYRYSLDAAPFLMLLTAAGMQGRINSLKRGLVVASILINWAGMAWMFAHLNGFGWVGMWYRVLVR